jgi:alpha-galactosidase
MRSDPMSQVQDWLRAATGERPGVRVSGRRQGWGSLRFDRAVTGLPLRLHGQAFPTGLGTHADSEIAVDAPADLARFRATVGVDGNPEPLAHSRSRVVFAVAAGGRELWRSRPLAVADPPEAVDLALPAGTRGLVLTAIAAEGDTHYAHADWAEARVVLADGSEVGLGEALPEGAPFAFRCDGRPSAELLPDWTRLVEARPEGAQVTWRDPASGLTCRLELRTFAGFPAVEWVLHLRNDGDRDGPLIEDLRSLAMPWNGGADVRLHRSRGSPCRIDDFEYLSEALPCGGRLAMAAGGGRSSCDWLPFFNLECGGGGVIAAIGWTGQWAAEFAHGDDGRIAINAGIENVHLRLRPGEEIRTPRILLLFWQDGRMAAHNALRRLILAHYTPQPDGRPLEGPLSIAHWGGMKTAEHLARLDAYVKAGIASGYYWIDAGWYGPADSHSPDEHSGDWARHVGNWQVNPAAHPHGLRPISEAAGKAGMRFLLWFEPERAIAGTPLTREHPEWFLGDARPGSTQLFDFGNPAARRWMTGFIGDLIAEHGVQLYRQDFNMDPLPFWRAADAPDRQGMHEIRHIEGLYAFWDGLLERFPGLVIDNCASGGRRLDLETTRRSIPLWRSDWQCVWTADPIGGQVQGMGLSHWLPLHGTGVIGGCRRAGDTYNFRSALAAALQFAVFPYESFPIRADYPYDWHRRMLEDFRRAQPLYRGDYYPLAGLGAASDLWAVYQMHRDDLG